MNLSEYILKSQEERQAHIDLTCECVLVKGNGSWQHRKKSHLDFLEIDNDLDNWTGVAGRLHACANDTYSQGAICVNPKHIYIGTPKENVGDAYPNAVPRISTQSQSEHHKKALGKSRRMKVIATNLRTKEVVEFDSSIEASEALGIPKSSISRVAHGHLPHYKGFVFKVLRR